MYAEVKLIAKMAAAVRQIGRWRPIFNGPIFLQTRTATKRQHQLEEHKRNDDVFLLNYRTPPSHTFTDAMSALRAYAINGVRQTVELQMKINMGENKTKVNPFHAKEAGANIVGGEELIKQVADGELTDFHQVMCTLEFLNKMRPLQNVLREKMPTTRRGTASDDIVTAITDYKQGHPYRCDRHGYINIGLGKLHFTDAEIRSNALAVISAVKSHRVAKKAMERSLQVVLLFCFMALCFAKSHQHSHKHDVHSEPGAKLKMKKGAVKESEDEDAKVEVSKAGDLVVVHYKGWLGDGSLFDTTIDPTKGYMPFEFVLGTGTVIKGFERGVRGMCSGQKREIIIPPSLGYGKKGAGEIPGNTTLTYELELLDIRPPPPQADMFSHIDTNGDKVLSKKEVSVYMKSQARAQGMPVHDKKWKKHHKMMVANIFEQEDTDEDGAISHDEFSGPKMIYHDEF
ncbi:Peptidyl-prolyl cis-trans isomerase FKBP14 [Acropora cervicornis]|uniref:peptidylprolyl isomerase n=1 Tax=Acropora cervicornis TaxID=6130 RepID=A0AAD9PSV2_ACRCE|nr:Peptidyl-prolyl cis-trans isomerase FKBP14 [Acropora cervicornis]